MKKNVQHYFRYDNQTRLHSANGDLSTIDFELSLSKVSGWGLTRTIALMHRYLTLSLIHITR